MAKNKHGRRALLKLKTKLNDSLLSYIEEHSSRMNFNMLTIYLLLQIKKPLSEKIPVNQYRSL